MARGHAPGRMAKHSQGEDEASFSCFSRFHFSVYGSSLVTAAMRGRLYANALLALVLALLLATTSAQENHQDSAGVPVGFDADAQAARDAEAYLTPEEKSLIQIGNDLLRGNDTIPDPEDYDVDAVRTRAPVSLTSYAHVPCAPDCGYERVWPDTHLQAPSSRRAFSVTKLPREASKHPSANRADVLLSLLRTRACRTGERLGERRGGRRVAPLSPGMALGARDFRGAGCDSYGGGVLRAEEAAGRARDGRRVRRR